MSMGQGVTETQGAPAQQESTGTVPDSTQGQGTPVSEPQQQQQVQEPQYSPFAQDFLQQIPEEHREIVGRYVQPWDAGVTRRFQELNSQLKPWQELGADPEEVANAMFVKQLLDTDPERVYQILVQNGVGQQQAAQIAAEVENEQGGTSQGLPPEVLERLNRNEEILQALATQILDGQRVEQEQAEDAALEDYLTGLRTEFKPHSDRFGDFDEDFVLARMEAGMDGAEAVKEWYTKAQELINNVVGKQGFTPPPAVLSGGGGAPAASAQKVTDLSRQDTKSVVAQMLSQISEDS